MNLSVASLVALVIPHFALAAGCPATPTRIAELIQHHIDRLEAVEYCDARREKSENGLTVVIYTAEGACARINPGATPGTCSNNWVRYMVTLSDDRITMPIQIGGKGGLTDTDLRIRNGVIEVRGLSPAPGDALCCPSVPETKKFKIIGNGLREVR